MVKQTDPRKGVIRYPGETSCKLKKTQKIPTHGITEPRFTSLGYDSCAYKLNIMESMAPGFYNLNGRVHYDSCQMSHPGYLPSNENKGILASSIDAESELKNLNYIHSRCPESRYNPMQHCKKCESCNSGLPCGCKHCKNKKMFNEKNKCSHQLIPKYTKQPKACNDITSQNINRFEPLCLDVQKLDRIQSNSYQGQPTRLIMKDLVTFARKHRNNY